MSDCLDVAGLAPGVTEDKDVIRGDPKHDENHKLVQSRVHGDLQDTTVEKVARWEGEENQQHGDSCHEETFEMKPNVDENEGDTEDGEGNVVCDHLLESHVEEGLTVRPDLD